jgi:hypothetical protein
MRLTQGLIARTGLMILVILFGLTACTGNPSEKKLSETFKQYETIIRWSQWDAAANFISAEYQLEHPITRLEMDRLRLFKVTAYTVRSTAILDEGMTARQSVEIRMFNSRQGVERTIMDDQEWRYNPETQLWKLHSGLPDPTNRY